MKGSIPSGSGPNPGRLAWHVWPARVFPLGFTATREAAGKIGLEATLGRCWARASNPSCGTLCRRWVRLPLASANPDARLSSFSTERFAAVGVLPCRNIYDPVHLLIILIVAPEPRERVSGEVTNFAAPRAFPHLRGVVSQLRHIASRLNRALLVPLSYTAAELGPLEWEFRSVLSGCHAATSRM